MPLTLVYLMQDGATPLFIASQEGHLEVVQLLLEAKADVNLQKEVSSLIFSPFSDTVILTNSLGNDR